MNLRHPRVAVWAIWSLVAAFAVVEGASWAIAGGVPQRPVAVLQAVAAGLVVLVLAAIATRRIGGLARAVTEHEHTQTETLDRVGELEMQNAILENISRSVDVPLAFQSLAQRIIRLVPCDRLGLALLTENGQEFQTYTARVHERAAHEAAARDRVQDRAHGARQRRALARAAHHQRHERGRG